MPSPYECSCTIVTRNKAMLKIVEMIEKIRDCSGPVLMEGEVGTGKELIARTIHSKGSRATKPFMALNCSALPETLVENELFGYEKEVLPDMRENMQGLFESANSGTLCLVHVSSLNLAVQARLLKVLEEGKIIPVGGTQERAVDVRIMAASCIDLQESVAEGKFREDLYDKLRETYIRGPPLRERKDDIPLLVDHFIKLYSSSKRRKVRGLSQDAMRVLTEHDWHRNVMSLECVIEQACILAEEDWLTTEHFPYLNPRDGA